MTENPITTATGSPACNGTAMTQDPSHQHEPERDPVMSTMNIPRGPGLFAIERSDGGETRRVVTNIRRLAGSERPPGSMLIASATWLLATLDAGLLYVSFDAQYRYIFAVKHARLPAMIEAAMLDAGMVILSALAIGLAMRGKASKTERFLIVICSAASAGMNFAAANPGSWRSVAAYTAAPIFLAIITDRVISVIRRHVLPDDTETAWAWLGRAVIRATRLAAIAALYLLRTVLAPKETAGGLRRMVLDAAPVPGVIHAPANQASEGSDELKDQHDGQQGEREDERSLQNEPEFTTKKAAFLARYRGHPLYGVREAASRVASELSPLTGLQSGTGRTYIGEELKRLESIAELLGAGQLTTGSAT